jgi:hypothetical protein
MMLFPEFAFDYFALAFEFLPDFFNSRLYFPEQLAFIVAPCATGSSIWSLFLLPFSIWLRWYDSV